MTVTERETNDLQTAIRMPRRLIERVDAYAEHFRELRPGIIVSRSDIIRLALGRGLDALETELQPPKKRRSG